MLFNTNPSNKIIIKTKRIAKRKSDKRNPVAKAIRDFDLGSVNVALIANENDKNYGVRCTFTISSPVSTDMNPENWNYNTIVSHS